MVFMGLSPRTMMPFFRMWPAESSLMVLFWNYAKLPLLPRTVRGVCFCEVYSVEGVSMEVRPPARLPRLGVAAVEIFTLGLEMRRVSLNHY